MTITSEWLPIRVNLQYLIYNENGHILFDQDFVGHYIIKDEEGVIYASDGHRFLAFRLPD